MGGTLKSGLRHGAVAGLLILGFCLCVCQTTAEEKAKQPASSGKGTDFAAKEQDTERLKALRKRVRDYEAALSRGVPPPAVESSMPEGWDKRPPKPDEKRAPRTIILEALQRDPIDKANLGALKGYLSTSTNAQDKALLGTAYCLGCLATDEWNEGTRMSILMRRAYPKDENVQLLSLKTFITACGKCAGEGKVEAKCDKCGGRNKCKFLGCKDGKLSNPDFGMQGNAPQCPMCGGKGECRSCDENGRIEIACSGRGNNLRRDTIEKGYVDFLRKIKP